MDAKKELEKLKKENQDLKHELEILSNKKVIRALRKATEDFKLGKYTIE